MAVLQIILGILMVLCAGSVLTVPFLSGTAICWAISFLMFVYGVFAIINYFESKNAEKVAKKTGKPHLKSGVGSLIFGIAAVILSVLARSSIIGEALFAYLISAIFGIWIIFNGVSYIVIGTEIKKTAEPGWLAMIIFGALIAVAGVYCIVNAFVSLTAMGIIFSISMMMSGFALIFSGTGE